MSSLWTINGTPVDTLGLSVVSGSMRSHGQSVMRLRAATDFDAAEILSFDDAVTLAYDGAPFFQGKVTATPKSANGSEEAQFYEIGDAWADLEKTIYQEEWKIGGSTTALLPRAVLGLGLVAGVWQRIEIGKQIRAAVEFAADQGVDIQAGTIPTGELMIPSEVQNMSCAEVIQQCLKLHPDWNPYIDHTTTPPTFNVAVSTTATAATFDLADGNISDIQITHRTDMLPEGVRIIYELATDIDGEVYRDVIIDKYPPSCPDGGPRVILATIPLAGLQMQTQKSRVQTRTIPTEAGTDAENYLKKKFPQLKDVDTDHMGIFAWSRELVDDDTLPDPISEQAPKLEVEDVDDVPRELVKGLIEEWMRKKVATVRIKMDVRSSPDATDAERKAIASLPSSFTITATNAVTKIYKGITQWIAPEDVPTGIAQATYSAIVNAMGYEGSITMEDQEIGTTNYAGRSVGIAGGAAGWVTMKAPVHSVDFDVDAGRVTIGFGPNPVLAPADFLELQRILRFRPSKWWSTDERDSDQIGATNAPSAAGDTVSGFDAADERAGAAVPKPEQFEIVSLFESGGTWTCKATAGDVLAIDPEGATVMGNVACAEATLTVSASHKIYCKVETSKQDLASAASFVSQTTAPADQHAQPDPGGQTGVYYYLIAEFETVSGALQVKTQRHKGGPIIHRPARNNRNLNVTISAWKESTGVLEPDTLYSGPTGLYFRQGLYVGQTDPGDTADTVELSVITGAS